MFGGRSKDAQDVEDGVIEVLQPQCKDGLITIFLSLFFFPGADPQTRRVSLFSFHSNSQVRQVSSFPS